MELAELEPTTCGSHERRPDVAEYPETGKIGIIADGKTWEFFRREDATEDAL